MKKVHVLISALVLFALTACAPVYYEAAYYDHVEPVYPHTSYRHEQLRGSIEVTLFADHTYLGLNFQPVHIVVYDGDYVEVPLRDKRGHLKRVFAHYHKGDLHFDANRSCRNITGTSRFKYDKRWEKGHRYDYISAGPDYDLRGYKLSVRKHKAENRKRQSRTSHYVAPMVKSNQSHVKTERIVKTVPKINRRPVKVLPDVVGTHKKRNKALQGKSSAGVKQEVKRVAPKRVLKQNIDIADKTNKKASNLNKRVTFNQEGKATRVYKGKRLVIKEDTKPLVKSEKLIKSQIKKVARNKQGKKSDHKEKRLVAPVKSRSVSGKRATRIVPSVEVAIEPEDNKNHPDRKMVKRNKADG